MDTIKYTSYNIGSSQWRFLVHEKLTLVKQIGESQQTSALSRHFL
jgi:hypothetical protein